MPAAEVNDKKENTFSAEDGCPSPVDFFSQGEGEKSSYDDKGYEAAQSYPALSGHIAQSGAQPLVYTFAESMRQNQQGRDKDKKCASELIQKTVPFPPKSSHDE